VGRRFFILLTAFVVTLAGAGVTTKAVASPAEEYTGTHFGLGNLPDGCASDTFDSPDNACYHMRTGMNGLDSPEVDVLLMVPASPTATRDMRIMRQAIEMWNGGIHYLAPQMGVPWMKNMHFHISTDIERATDGFVVYPIVDPEIVVIATNPVGGLGIGIDPYATVMGALGRDENLPCSGVQNPFDLATWQNLPGYSHHGDERGATVTEDCGGLGGNVCFAINTAIDPDPQNLDVFNLFDLVAHEFGHCLTIGHVGDGAEGPWSKVPTNDIMSYNADPPGLNKCVSTLDVEGIAVTQSHYLDADGDGAVTTRDHVDANERKWDSTTDHFQVQNPRDHYYASSTGSPFDCPQPYLGLPPGGPRTNWQPAPKSTSTNELRVTAPSDRATTSDGTFHVRGTVEHVMRAGKTATSPAKAPPGPARKSVETVQFHHKGGNHFTLTDTSLGIGLRPADHFTLKVPERADVSFTLSFTDGQSDLDLFASGKGYDSGSAGATSSNPEKVAAPNFSGTLAIDVDPYLIANPVSGVDYTLTAVLSPPKEGAAAVAATARPVREHVRVYIDDTKAWAAHQDVDTLDGPAPFNIGLFVPKGTHTLRVEWDRFGKVVATKSVRVTSR
jgi:hypothetical protein